jgi:putative FmdB family regulatory protein
MPIYEYHTTTDRHCNFCRAGFDIMQKIADAPLSSCPECQAPVERQLSAPQIHRSGPSLDASNIEKHGFTQYRRSGQGVYEKTAGKGPDILKDD